MSIKKGYKVIAGAPLEPVWGTISGNIRDQEDLQQALREKVGTDSPAFTGTPTAPTPGLGISNNQIATTKFVHEAIETVDALPSQSGQSGKFLTTNGTSASWGKLPEEIFIATYNSTTYSEISDAHNAGKVCYCKFGEYLFPLVQITTSVIRFINLLNGMYATRVVVTSDNVWSSANISLNVSGQVANKVLITNDSGYGTTSSVTSTELGYLSGITSSVQTQLNNKQPTLVSGTNIKTINNTSILGNGNIDTTELPSQSGQSGKYLTTNGSNVSWSTVDSLPTQAGNSGKFLTTDGTNASWSSITTLSEYAKDADVVKITGNQDVDGIKTFLKPMYSKLVYLDLTTTPTSTVRQNWIRAYDKNGTEVAVVRSEYSTNNSLNNSLTTIRQVNNSTIYSSIYTGITADGKKYQGIDFPGDTNAVVNQIDTVSARNAAINAHHDSTKQDTLTTGSNIDITNNVISVVDDNFVHKTGTETITGIKTFSDSVSFLGDGDAHCIYIGKNTPINVSGTNQTVLGMIGSRPTLGHTAYSLQLRGSATRPSYNNSDIALLSDVSVKQDELVSGTNIKTINNQSILGSGNISITGLPSQTSQSGKFLTTNGTTASWAKITIPEVEAYTASEVQTIWDSITPANS